ncbi:MAG TPA: hypothetical protein VL379_09920 [Pseudomonadales bacterium]|nr:hypothetical protein [Pseudomonadales bacterium]
MSPHLSQVLAGLYELRAMGQVDLDFRATPDDLYEGLLLAEVSGETRTRRVCFDMRDGPIIDRTALAQNDVYFKRTYTRSELCDLPADARAKVRPYGLNYACSSRTQLRSIPFAKQLLFRKPTRSERNEGPLRSMRHLISHPVKWLGGPVIEVEASSPLHYTEFEATADSPADRGVVFLTRLWCGAGKPADVADRFRQLNEDRIELIATLRARLGDCFVGGVERNHISEQLCPHYIVDQETIKTNYVALMKRHLIGVATPGLHGSIGWKFPEYLAAARCIVSQPLRREDSYGLVEGTHYLPFHTADECANACERLLNDAALAQAMRRSNEDYYRNELKPPVMMLKRLHTAIAAG